MANGSPPSAASQDAASALPDALMHLSDVLMREMFSLSMMVNLDFAHAAGDPAAANAHRLIAQLGQRVNELRG